MDLFVELYRAFWQLRWLYDDWSKLTEKAFGMGFVPFWNAEKIEYLRLIMRMPITVSEFRRLRWTSILKRLCGFFEGLRFLREGVGGRGLALRRLSCHLVENIFWNQNLNIFCNFTINVKQKLSIDEIILQWCDT